MAIKKRTSVPEYAEETPTKLVIVTRPKKPIPERGIIRSMYGPDATDDQVRRLGAIADDCGFISDEVFTIEDRVTAMRSVYDKDNPQEARYRNRVRNRGTAITALCITCTGGRKAVTECIDTQCPLWAFRFGSDPFYGNRKKNNGQ